MTKANDRQVGGEHYRKHSTEIQHWDYATLKKFDFFQYQITKYVERWRDKNGIKDLEKAAHFLEKYIEVEKNKSSPVITGHLVGIENNRLKDIPLATGMENPFGYNAAEE